MKLGFDIFVSVFKVLWPNLAETPEDLFKWRQFVAVFLLGLAISLTTFVLHATGNAPWFRGYAARDGQDVLIKLNLEEQMIRAKTRWCNGRLMENLDAMLSASELMKIHRQEYVEIFNHAPATILCRELLINVEG